MPTLWFCIISVMLTCYVILDGFDIGAGAIHLFAARTDGERKKVIRAIGPVWDGNEVWLLATGGVLYFVFPQLYASSFSGFYLPLMMVLWLLMLRAIGIEFRTHIEQDVWKSFFDAVFALASVLLAIFYGAALGNVVRGVPLGPDHYFFLPLFTNWRVGPQPGILDWYTVLSGVLALVALASHGAHYVALKTEADVNQRARSIAAVLWPAQLLLTLLSLVATLVDSSRRCWPTTRPRPSDTSSHWRSSAASSPCSSSAARATIWARFWPRRFIWRSCWWARSSRSIR